MDDLISRQTAQRLFAKALTYQERVGRYKWVTAEVKQWIADFIEDLPSAQQWIPCSERLPIAKHKTYWICTDTGHQCECRWTNVNHFWTNLTTEWHWHIMDIPQYIKVVAWCELPEPYREVDE